MCRRFGENIFGTAKYDRILGKRNFPAGQHGKSFRRKVSDYGLHLKEKQKLRLTYCLLERQFHNYFVKAEKMQGVTGDNLMQMLERRFDNVVYRMGFAVTRMQARQFVSHGHFTINGKKVDIPSLLVKPGDIIEIREKSRGNKMIQEAMERTEATSPYGWLSVNKANMNGQFLSVPAAADIPSTVDVRLIVEFYSK